MKYVITVLLFIILSCTPVQVREEDILPSLISNNRRINSILVYETDMILYGAQDYWASYSETQNRLSGDCEDYSIYKLKEFISLGVDSNKLRLGYVIHHELGAHMVLEYYNTKDPLIFDNLTDDVLPLSKRTDISRIYSFGKRWVYAGGREYQITPKRIRKFFEGK